MNKTIFSLVILLFVTLFYFENVEEENLSLKPKVDSIKPKIAFSFDDGSTEDMPNFKSEVWNQLLLDALAKHHLQAALFVTGSRLQGARGRAVLNSWNTQGHKIGNHTYSHHSYANQENTVDQFEQELMKNDSLIRNYSNYYPYFRFPYLKEGNTRAKIDSIRDVLIHHGYKNAHVTIDASDWYVSSRLVQRLRKNPSANIQGFRDFYVNHLFDRSQYYDSLSFGLTQRKINHVILLHHNLAAALFLDDLIQHFQTHGWEIVNTDQAYQDKIYSTITTQIPAGESLIWSLAKQSPRFAQSLRYPAEDGAYEKATMDRLGL